MCNWRFPSFPWILTWNFARWYREVKYSLLFFLKINHNIFTNNKQKFHNRKLKIKPLNQTILSSFQNRSSCHKIISTSIHLLFIKFSNPWFTFGNWWKKKKEIIFPSLFSYSLIIFYLSIPINIYSHAHTWIVEIFTEETSCRFFT